jgi:hypothetical protein
MVVVCEIMARGLTKAARMGEVATIRHYWLELTRVTRSPAFGADSACGSMVLRILYVRFFCAERRKTEHKQK